MNLLDYTFLKIYNFLMVDINYHKYKSGNTNYCNLNCRQFRYRSYQLYHWNWIGKKNILKIQTQELSNYIILDTIFLFCMIYIGLVQKINYFNEL